MPVTYSIHQTGGIYYGSLKVVHLPKPDIAAPVVNQEFNPETTVTSLNNEVITPKRRGRPKKVK